MQCVVLLTRDDGDGKQMCDEDGEASCTEPSERSGAEMHRDSFSLSIGSPQHQSLRHCNKRNAVLCNLRFVSDSLPHVKKANSSHFYQISKRFFLFVWKITFQEMDFLREKVRTTHGLVRVEREFEILEKKMSDERPRFGRQKTASSPLRVNESSSLKIVRRKSDLGVIAA